MSSLFHEIIVRYMVEVAPVVLVNLQWALAAIAGGVVVGFLLGWARVSRFRALQAFSRGYTEVIRGTPLLIQIFIVFFSFPAFNVAMANLGIPLRIEISEVQRVILAFAINTSAYQAEIFRAGFQSIATGQIEAATSIGMTRGQTMRHIIVPQTLRIITPPLTNEYIIMFKDATPLAIIVAVPELLRATRTFAEATATFLLSPLLAGVVFLAFSLMLTLFLRLLERRFAVPGLGIAARAGGG